MDKLGSRVEVDAHVKGRGVVSLDPVVGDVHSRVILGSASPLALRAVQNVCDTESGQLTAVRGNVSEERRVGSVFSVIEILPN